MLMRGAALVGLLAVLALPSPQSPANRQKQQELSNHKKADAEHSTAQITVITVNPQSSGQQEKKTESKPSQWPPISDIYWPTLALVIVGVIGTVIAIVTLKDLARQTVATEQAADAARINARALIEAERALIRVELVSTSYKGKDGRWYGEDRVPFTPADVLAGKHLLYSMKMTNVGRTPAHILEYQISYSCLPEGVTDIPPVGGSGLVEERGFNHLLTAGAAIEIMEPINIGFYMKDSWKEILECEKTAVVYGWVKYRHIFSATEECRTDYCYSYTASLERLSSVGRHTHYT
jgi:hypothetical protein